MASAIADRRPTNNCNDTMTGAEYELEGSAASVSDALNLRDDLVRGIQGMSRANVLEPSRAAGRFEKSSQCTFKAGFGTQGLAP